MQKARSRLAAPAKKPPQVHNSKIRSRLRIYLRTSPFGLMGILTSYGLYYILTSIPPKAIADIPLANTYGPLLGLFFLTSFFLIGYVLHHTRRGLLLAVAMTLLLFFHFQHIVVEKFTVVVLVATLFAIEMFAQLKQKR